MASAPILRLIPLALFLTAGTAGYLLSSKIGPEALRAEAEAQLSLLLGAPVSVERTRIYLNPGVCLEGEILRTYPGGTAQGKRGDGLTVRRATAGVDFWALLLGRFELRWLQLEGVHLHIERGRDGQWQPLPLAALERDRDERPPDDLEEYLAIPAAIETASRILLEGVVVAKRVELREGSITFVDHLAGPEPGRPLVYRIDRLEGRLEHGWLSGSRLSLEWTFSQRPGSRVRFEVEGRRTRSQGLRVSIAATNLPLETFLPYAVILTPEHPLRGTLSGVIVFQSPEPGLGALEIDWLMRDLSTVVSLSEAGLPIDTRLTLLEARAEIHPGRLRLVNADFSGGDVELSVSGVVERPLRPSSLASLSAELRGLGLDQVRRVMASLPAADRETVSALLEPIATGGIDQMAVTATARIGVWTKLVRGELTELPAGVSFSLGLRDVVLGTEERDRIHVNQATLEWSGDRIHLRDVEAHWNERPLPRVTLTLDGFSQVLVGQSDDELLADASPLPGLPALWALLGGVSADSEDASPGASPPPVSLAIDYLHHPALRRPIRDARVAVNPVEGGFEFLLAEATWGGAPIRGSALWLGEPKPRIAIDVEVRKRAAEDDDGRAPFTAARATGPRSLGRRDWGAGSFEIGAIRDTVFPFERVRGRFSLREATVELQDVEATLLPSGRLRSRGRIGLETLDVVHVELGFDLEDGDVQQLVAAAGLPDDFATGALHATGSLTGPIHVGVMPLARLKGTVSVHASDGEIRRKIPVAAAIANITEGFNPFSANEAVHYETIDAELSLDDGRVSSDHFSLDGPLRVIAYGYADIGRPHQKVEAVVGIFILRQVDLALGKIPLVKYLTDSDRGLFGAYVEVTGSWDEPKVRTLPIKSLTQGTVLTDLVTAPWKALKDLAALLGMDRDRSREDDR